MYLPTFVGSIFDLVTLCLISALITLSVLSLCFIFHLRLKSQSLTHLQEFNSLWAVRFALVLLIILWSLSHLLRLPLFRHAYLPSSLQLHHSCFCKLHIVLSLGFFQPAFLVTLLFLLNASIRQKTPHDLSHISFLLFICLPLAFLHTLILIFKPLRLRLPDSFHQTDLLSDHSDDTVLCAYPILNSIAFAAFGLSYAVFFLCSCWKVLSLVINKGLRLRIYGLVFVVIASLILQIVFLALASLSNPNDHAYAVATLMIFVGAFCSATVGEGILVIKPISDALDAGGSCCRFPRYRHCASPTSEKRPSV